jgi:hypothetical protein
MIDAQDLANRYVAVWNESEPEHRQRQIAALWVPHGQHYTDVREARGYDALEQRIVGSYNKNVRDGGHRFRPRQDAQTLRDIVTFQWEMLAAADDRVVASGLAVLRIDDEGRILVDYLFMH